MKRHMPVFGFHQEQEYIPAYGWTDCAYITDDMGECVEVTASLGIQADVCINWENPEEF